MPSGRVIGLDVARYGALVAMMATHVLDPSGPTGDVTVVQQVAGGRAAALFAVLAGVSLSLMSGRMVAVRGTELRAVSAGLALRAVLVAAIGLALGALPTNILVILAYYGVLFLLGIPFLRLGARALAVLAGAWVVVVPVLMHLLRSHLAEAPVQSPTLASIADPGSLLVDLTVTGAYPALPWLGYLFAGMALGRLDLSRWRTPYDLVVVGACLAAVSWAVSTVLVSRSGVVERLEETLPATYGGDLDYALTHGLQGATPTQTWWWLGVDAPHTGTPFDLVHTIGSALVVIGLALLVGWLAPRVATVAFGAGAMTLTLYSLHVVLRTPPFLPDDDLRTFLSHVVIVTLIGSAYRLERRSGPFERVVTVLSRKVSAVVRG